MASISNNPSTPFKNGVVFGAGMETGRLGIVALEVIGTAAIPVVIANPGTILVIGAVGAVSIGVGYVAAKIFPQN